MFKVTYKKFPYDVCFSQETYRHVRTAIDHSISALTVIEQELPPNTPEDARGALRATRRLLIIAYYKMQGDRYGIPRPTDRPPETLVTNADEMPLLPKADPGPGHTIGQ